MEKKEKEKDSEITYNVFLSTRHRDTTLYPSPSSFVIDLPATLNNVYGVRIRNFKYVPEPLINNNTNTFSFTANGGSVSANITLTKGDYNQDITTLLAEINNHLLPYGVQFTINAPTGNVQFGFSSGYVTDYFTIPQCRLLNILGFPAGIWLYRAGNAPSQNILPSQTTPYNTVAIASNTYQELNYTDMIIRVVDLEAIQSFDSVCNRATAILMSSRSSQSVLSKNTNQMFRLLQQQHRLQRLRITILNSYGDLYDLDQEEASFMFEFYCKNS